MQEILKTKLLPLLVLLIIVGLLMSFTQVTASATELPEEDYTDYPYEDEYEYYEEQPIELPDEYYWEMEPAFDDGPAPFTPDGTGTVINNATDGDGKEFYVIESPDGNIFYLVIDRQRSTDNVYFLGAVTDEDLLPLAKSTDDETQGVEDAPAVSIKTEPATEKPGMETDNKTAQSSPPAQENSDIMLYVLLGIAVIGIGGAGYYFKIVKPKKEGSAYDDDYGEDYGDDDGYSDNDNAGNNDDDEGYDDEDGYEDEADTDFDDGAPVAPSDGYNAKSAVAAAQGSGNSPPYQGNRSQRRRKKRRRPNYNGH